VTSLPVTLIPKPYNCLYSLRQSRRLSGRVSWPSNTQYAPRPKTARWTSQTPPSAALSTSDPKKLSRKVVLRQRPLIAEGSWAAALRRWWTGHRAAASAALKTVIDASFGRPLQALFRDAERSNTLARRRALPGRTE
jgi:hypothetical protein